MEGEMPLYPAIKLMDPVITPDAFDFTTEPTAPEPGVWDRNQEIMDGKVEMVDHTFVEPVSKTTDVTSTALAQGWGPWEVNPGLTTEPTTAADFDNDGDVDGRDFLVWRRADGDDSSIDALAVDPTDPNAEVNQNDLTVVKLL